MFMANVRSDRRNGKSVLYLRLERGEEYPLCSAIS